MTIIGLAYRNAETNTDAWHYHLFWIGMLVFVVPTAASLLSPATRRAQRLQLVCALGLFAVVPKLFRDPTGPLWYDELAHWRQTESIHSAQSLFQDNPLIPAIREFPGLHAATDVLRELTGASTFVAGGALIAAAHLSALVAVFLIAERLCKSARAGGIAALVYCCSPGFFIFNTQFAYESLGIAFFVWTVAIFVLLYDARRSRVGLLLVGVLVVVGGAATHHISSYVAAVVVLLSAIIMLRRRGLGESRLLLAFAGAAVVAPVAWLLLAASGTIDYLGPVVGGGVSETFSLLSDPGGGRTLFSNSTLPVYERGAAFLAPVIGGVVVMVVGLWSIRRSRSLAPAMVSLTVLGIAYFPALPFFLTTAGNEGARRSLDFSYLGIAVLVAAAAVALLPGFSGLAPTGLKRLGLIAASIGCGVILMMGGIASGFNELYRFPGPFLYGSDARSQTPELKGSADWFLATHGPNQRIVADRYNGQVFASRGLQWTATPSQGFPIWNLYLHKGPPDLDLLRQLDATGWNYLLIDERMAENLPQYVGYYFGPDEPGAFEHSAPVPRAALEQYAHLPWVQNIYSSDTLRLYRFDFDAIHLGGESHVP